MNKKIENLRKMVQKKNDTMEYRTCKIKGVGNLSRSDRDGILMYLDEIEEHGNINNLLSPSLEVKQVLINSGIIN